MMTQLTVTGPFVNKTLFEQAKVPLPGPKATWDEWVDADAQGREGDAGAVRDGVRPQRPSLRGPGDQPWARSIFDAKGNLVVDDGYKAMAKKFYDWNRDGTMPKEVWGGVGGSTYRDAFEEFANGRVVHVPVRQLADPPHGHADRQELRLDRRCRIRAVPAACTGMPGGAAFVALKRTKNPEGRRALPRLSSRAMPVYAEYMARTENIPANAAVAKKGVDYNVSPPAKAALERVRRARSASSRRSPTRSRATSYNRAMFNPTAARLGQAIAGEMSLDDALKRISADIDEQVKAAAK